MNLVIVSPFPPAITGIGQYGYHITRALATSEAFTRITVLAGSRFDGQKPNHLGKTEVEYCWAPGQLRARPAIMSRVQRLHPDLVWFNAGASIFGKSPWLNVSGLLTPIFIQQTGIPTVVTVHELVELADLRALNAPGGSLARVGARLLTHITSQADVVCLTMKNYADWLSARGVDCTHIPIGAYHEPELLADSPSQELLFFTTLAPFKGLELLLEAFGALRNDHPKLSLTIAGADHIRFPHYSEQLKARFGNLKGVNWLGQTSEEQVKGLFRRAQLVVLPYTASTGSSSVLYQAATWGRAVVVSDLGEIKNLAEESDLKVEFFKSGDVTSLSNTIRVMLSSPEKRKNQAAHNFAAIQRTRPYETSRKYLQAFDRALEKRLSSKRLAIPACGEKPA
jgi:glycosyltransferase involved in cell wall biosynthesis